MATRCFCPPESVVPFSPTPNHNLCSEVVLTSFSNDAACAAIIILERSRFSICNGNIIIHSF